VRISLGSRPVNELASSLNRELGAKPSVATPNWMCEASCQWWPIVDSGMSYAMRRCMNAGGPSAGSPG